MRTPPRARDRAERRAYRTAQCQQLRHGGGERRRIPRSHDPDRVADARHIPHVLALWDARMIIAT
jgi:hypothetical protein